MGGISSQIDACNEEREMVLRKFFPSMLRDALKAAAHMKKQPLYELFWELSNTRRFQHRIKPVIAFLVGLNKCFSRRR